MDKKNTIIGLFLLLAAFASLYVGQKLSPSPRPSAPELVRPTSGSPLAPAQGVPAVAAPTSPKDAAFAAAVKDNADAQITTLANEFIEARFTDFGGALRDVALKKYDAEKDRPGIPYVFNQQHADPALALVDFPGLDRHTRYQLVSSSGSEVVYRAVFENRIEVIRRYTLFAPNTKGHDPYQVRHETTFRNLTDQTAGLPRIAISLGTAAPLKSDSIGQFLTTGHNVAGEIEFTPRSELEGGGFLSFIGIGSRGPIASKESGGPLVWGSVSNQFFTSIFTPDQPGGGLITRRVELPGFADGPELAYGITGAARLDVPALPPRGEAKLAGNFYVGPKEYSRLTNADVFPHNEDKVMQFGFFKFFSQILLTLMTWVHSWAPNWGVAIVITTLTLKIVFVPLTLAASKSAKRMQKLQPEMQALREKYKDNPQKMQTETMAIFKKHRVNPVGGCLPILVTIPFFMGFFTMLQSTAELRFAEFLWAKDLSAPDTIAVFFGLPINIMPILMGATMVYQMRLVPQPTVDNAQAKIFKFMPIIFTLFCYTFSCALSLYSTVNGLFTIVQQLVINRMKDDDVTSPGGAAAATTATLGKAVRNVTPRKKK